MLEKTMKQMIKKKVNEWIDSIDDERVKEAVEEDLIITGGCFTSMIQNESPNDFDFYFRTKESVIKVAEYYVRKWNERHCKDDNYREVFVLDGADPSSDLLSKYGLSSLKESESDTLARTPPERVKIIFPSEGITGDPEEARAGEELGVDPETIEEIDESREEEYKNQEKEKYSPVFLSTNAITLSGGIQIIVRFYGEPGEIHQTYDFEHTKAYYDIKEDQINIPNSVYETTVNKTLWYTGSTYPVCSLFRLRKFIARGWSINAGQILKIAMQISELDLNDIDVLEDQLVGVDSLYFMRLIEQFRKKKENNPDFDLTSEYVMSVVDRIF